MELEKAKCIAEQIKAVLESSCDRIEICGSIRRCKPYPNDLELLCIPKYSVGKDMLDAKIQTMIYFDMLGYRLNKLGRKVYGPKNKLMVHIPSGIAVDLFSSTEENWGMALFVRTGPREWNIRAMSRFRELGMQGHAYGGISHSDGSELNCPDEETVFRYLGWAYVLPERRTC